MSKYDNFRKFSSKFCDFAAFFSQKSFVWVPLDFYVANWRNLSLGKCCQSHQTEQLITNAIPQYSMLLNELDWHLHIYWLHNENNFFLYITQNWHCILFWLLHTVTQCAPKLQASCFPDYDTIVQLLLSWEHLV